MATPDPIPVVAVSAGESSASRTTALVADGLARAGGEAAGHQLIELARLDAAGLLGRTEDEAVVAARAAVAGARRLVLATPVYRATYAGVLKLLLDHLPQEALAGSATVLVATAASRDHYLALDTGFRSLVASLGGWTVPTVVYATPEDFDQDRRPRPPILDRLEAALGESELLARHLS